MATYTCKYCGAQNSSANFARNPCSKSPHKTHELMSATEKLSRYTCKHCGASNPSPRCAANSCSKSPHKTHELLG